MTSYRDSGARRLCPQQAPGLAAWFRVLVLLGATGLLPGCQPPVDEHGERILDTVEVEAGATSGISHEEDRKASRSDLRGESQLAGVLPGGFPKDLPLPLPASVLGFGDEQDRWVELSVPRSHSALQSFLERRWRGAGWRDVDGAWQRGERRIEATVSQGENEGESLLRIAYR